MKWCFSNPHSPDIGGKTPVRKHNYSLTRKKLFLDFLGFSKFPDISRFSRLSRSVCTFRNEKHLGLLSSETIVLMHTNCEMICCYVTEKPLYRGHLLPADTFFRNRLVSCKILIRKPLCTGSSQWTPPDNGHFSRSQLKICT